MMTNSALGDEVTAELDVEAGIDSAVTVTCPDALSFGTTTFNDGEALGADMEISVDKDGALTATNAPELSALGEGQAGRCNVFNSESSNETNISVEYPDVTDNKVALTGRDSALGLESAGSPTDDLVVKLSDPLKITPEIDGNGETSFTITGTLTMPTNAPSQKGGYGGTIEVLGNDSP